MRPAAADAATVVNRHTGEAITFLGVHRDEAGDYLLIRTSVPPRGEGPPEHVHPEQDEEGVVLAGRVAVRLNGGVREYGVGQRLRIPAGVAHTWWNPGDEPMVTEAKVRPPLGFESFIREMFAAMNAAPDGRPSPWVALDILARHPRDQRIPRVPAWAHARVLPLVVALARALGAYRGREGSEGSATPGVPKSRP